MGKYFAVFASTHLSIPLLVKKKMGLREGFARATRFDNIT